MDPFLRMNFMSSHPTGNKGKQQLTFVLHPPLSSNLKKQPIIELRKQENEVQEEAHGRSCVPTCEDPCETELEVTGWRVINRKDN